MITIVNQTTLRRARADNRSFLYEREVRPRVMRGVLRSRASIVRRRFTSTMCHVYQAQLSQVCRVRFFIFPHWVLGQCESLISERFSDCPSPHAW